jgi:hypothetical protein
MKPLLPPGQHRLPSLALPSERGGCVASAAVRASCVPPSPASAGEGWGEGEDLALVRCSFETRGMHAISMRLSNQKHLKTRIKPALSLFFGVPE